MRCKELALKLCFLLLANSVFLNSQALSQSEPKVAQAATGGVHYGSLPLMFEANQGQTDAQVKFLSRGKGYTALLTSDGMILSLRPSTRGARQAIPNNSKTPITEPSTIMQFSLVGAAANPTVIGEDVQPGKINYFFGSDPTKWRTNVATYGRIRYHGVYPGIDMLYYGNHRQLEYDFVISPGADPGQIQFAVKGANSISLDSDGNLVLNTENGDLHFQSPTVYQDSNGTRVPVQGEYVIKDSTHVGFHLSAFDPSKPTVIDPVLAYGTFLGGSGDDQANGIGVDASGNVYIAGSTDSADFPLALFGSLTAGNAHVFVAKLNATGSTLLYADYLGGSGYDYGYALTLDSAGEVYVTGSTNSSNFPVLNSYQSTYPGGFNAFITKVSADGSSLLYSTYFGGNGSDIPASIVLDSSSDILIAGNTTSNNLPVANAYQSAISANQGGQFGNYGFLSKFNPDGSQLIYSTYFAGSSNVAYNCSGTPCWSFPFSAVTGLTVDGAGNAYVGGNTNTYNFPTTTGVYQTSSNAPQNNTAGFVAKFSSSGSLSYSTYFDESSGYLTTINAIAVDATGSAYVTGSAFSDGTFPQTSTSICDPSVYGQNCEFAFVTKFDPLAATLVYSTFLGPYNLSTPIAISLDASNDAYVLASTNSTSFQLVNGIEGFSTEGSQYVAGSDDALLAEIDPAGASELFATYIGGSGNNMAGAMTLDASANLYVAGTTDSIDFPVSQAGFQEIIGGNTDAFITKISPVSAAAVSLAPFSLEYSSQSLGTTSASQTVLLRNMGSAALNISSITASTGFGETDTCSGSVPSAGTCTLSVSFAPNALGSDSGSISIADDAAGSPHVISVSGVGTGAVAALAPASLTFGTLPVGTASAQQIVTLSNSGNTSLTIGGIYVSGDFSQTNNCGTSLTANASCRIQIIFTPTATGARSGVLSITDNAVSAHHITGDSVIESSQTVALSGTGQAAIGITLSATTLTFVGVVLDSSSGSQSITLTNHAIKSATVSNVSVTGDFSQTNNCSTVAVSGGTCSVTVKFVPSASGVRVGTLAISTSVGLETVSLSGTGLDFSLASSTTSDTIQDGATATYKLTVSPVGGTFTSAIKLSCSGAPTGATCTFSPSTLTPGSTPVSVTMAIVTTASTAQAFHGRSSKSYLAFAMWVQFQGLGLFGIVFASSKRSKKPASMKLAMLILLTLLISAMLFMSACAGGTGIAHSQTGGQTGTQAGTYPVSATGICGSLKHSVSLTLNVQQN